MAVEKVWGDHGEAHLARSWLPPERRGPAGSRGAPSPHRRHPLLNLRSDLCVFTLVWNLLWGFGVFF